MDYPNNFDIPSMPAGKTVAFSRSVAVWISILFFLIIVACGFVLLGIHSKTNYPFLISVDPFTDEWAVIAYPKNKKEKIPWYQIIQEKLVNDYVTDWFTISNNQKINEMRWKNCSVEECKSPDKFKPGNIDCAISCKSDTELFETFSDKVLTEYRARVEQRKETWTVNNLLITPDKTSEQSGKWQVYASITSNINRKFNVLIFINIDRNISAYPINFGYYIKDFNAYRDMNNE